MEGEIKNLSNVCYYVMASLSYCYFVSSKVPPGVYRFVSILPIFFLFTILPYHLSSAFNTAVLTFIITWLSNSKLLLFSFGSGPLSSHNNHSFIFFLSTASLPIIIKKNTTATTTSTNNLVPLIFSIELLAFAILARALYMYKQRLHQKMIECIYCCLCFLLIDILITISSALVRALVGVELEPASNQPYLSTSLQDFWGRRWNLTVTTTLRDTVYKPVREVTARLIVKDLARVTGVLATFLVSGLIHELLFYNVTRVPPTWEMTWFFVLHGICVVVEVGLKNRVQISLPWMVRVGLTVGFVVGTSLWLFFPPLVRSGADKRVLEEMTFCVHLIRAHLIKLVYSVYI